MLKIAVLSVSLLTIMTGASVSPVLAEIARAFPESGSTMIKLVLTVPALIIIPTSFITGRYGHMINRRRLLIIGLILYVAGGAGGGLSTSIYMLYGFRALLGAGAGIVIPVSTGIIVDLFKGNERTVMMGYSTAISSLGGVIATSASGFLASFGWRFSFGIYFIGLVVLLFNILWLPSVTGSNVRGRGGGISFKVFIAGTGMFGVMAVFYAIPTNIAWLFSDSGIGGPDRVGTALSVQIATGFLAGVCLKYSRDFAGALLLPGSLLVFGAGFWGLAQAESMVVAVVSMMAVGMALGTMIPSIFLKAVSAGGKGEGIKSVSIVISLSFLGQFLSPLVLDVVSECVGISGPAELFNLIGIVVVAGVILYFFGKNLQPRNLI